VRFLLREDMLDEDAHLRFGAIGLARVVGHRLALGLLAVDAADPAIGFESRFIAFGAVSGIGPDVGCCVVRRHDFAEL
jgi:hypothetical protein